MPPKKRPPAPIDRPLSKAYLREFAGWSTAYPPGLSEPTSIRAMENVHITREGAARVRPGLQSYLRTKSPLPLVGSHELFYLPNGKAYLVAVRETVDVGTPEEREIVGFRVIGHNEAGELVMDTLSAFGFDVPSTPNVLSFTSATTYVKYLQIDNKIFALSDAPEGMLMFWVGTEKKAKKLSPIIRPEWTVGDKLAPMQPSGTWIQDSAPLSIRTNLMPNPDFETGSHGWNPASLTTEIGLAPNPSVGIRGLRARIKPLRTNLMYSPLHDVANTGTYGWTAWNGSLSVVWPAMRITSQINTAFSAAHTVPLEIVDGERIRVVFDLEGRSNIDRLRVDFLWYAAGGFFINTESVMSSATSTSPGRKFSNYTTPPVGATHLEVQIGFKPAVASSPAYIDIKDVMLGNDADVDNHASLDGDDGAYASWVGTPNNSRSVYAPPRDLGVSCTPMSISAGSYTVSADVLAEPGYNVVLGVTAISGIGVTLETRTSVMNSPGTRQRMSVTIPAPAGSTYLYVWAEMFSVEWQHFLDLDAVLVERSPTANAYFSGNTPNAGTTKRRWTGPPNNSTSVEEDVNPVLPTAVTPSANTLVSSNALANRHTFTFFYTISNELGESAASQMSSIRVQRPWTMWEWLDPNGVSTDDPEKCRDQLVVVMPQEVFDAAVASGATHWTAYYYYQGPNDAPPVTATRFAEIDLTQEPDYDEHGYARLTPQMVKIGVGDPLIPSASTRHNASDPVKGSQGIVAADRLVLVGNPADPARISWSSGAPGDYHNFSSLLGGGTKQLTSGNIYVTACVKLWQNPQSVETLTVLNMGDDGRSNAYYMQPAQITSLSESISVMGFEEITSMDGTVSPYGCEVVNNGLYRPQFHGLYKSTANNYNLSTKSVSDTIQNMWTALRAKRRIVSSQLDSRIYYLVDNPQGADLEPHCRGNEVWVIDLAAETPTWSRWLVQGTSLRAMDLGGKVMMSIIRPDGIFMFNESRYTDEKFNAVTGDLETVNISWYLETNTQGANRAHDAWCNLQQANAHVGNFFGQMRYGIRGQDVNGKPVEIEKVLLSDNPPPVVQPGEDALLYPTEREDYLLIRKIIKEWVFFAGSVNDDVDDELVPRFSGGQINSVQYRYTPATVNVGYEYGSVETFEYGQSHLAEATTDSGTPKPYVDLTRA